MDIKLYEISVRDVFDGYELMHEKSFPTLQVGSRLVVPRDKFIDWMNGKISR